MKLKVREQFELSPLFDLQRVYDKLNPWEQEIPTRQSVASALREIFPGYPVYTGGHHVAVHNQLTGNRMLLITGTSPDFS